MSLINRVLNNLEKRGANTSIGGAAMRVVPLQQSHVAFWVVVAVITVLVLAGSAWLKWGADMQLNTPQFVLNTAPISAEPVAAIAVAEVAALTTIPLVTAEMEPAAQVESIATAEVPVVATLPLVLQPPAIVSVNSKPAISLGKAKIVTIAGNGFADDAKVVLRNPEGKVYVKQKVVAQNKNQIAIRVNFGSMSGNWSVEVVHASGDSTGEFAFVVLPAPVVASQQEQGKAALPETSNALNLENAANLAKQVPIEKPPVALADGGVRKRATQINLQQQAENEYRKALVLMKQGQPIAAITGFETALQLDAGHVEARQTLARLLLGYQRNADAERLLQLGLQLDTKQSNLAMLLARIQVGRNDLAQALETLQVSLPYAGKLPDYRAYMAALLQRQNRHREAIIHFRNALQLNPQSGVWLMGMGISLRAEKKNAEARDVFKRALDSNTLNAELREFVMQQLREISQEL